MIVSVNTLIGERMFEALRDTDVPPYDLAVFDEAHKLSATVESGRINKTQRYELAEALAGCVAPASHFDGLGWAVRHLLLLTATPHMGPGLALPLSLAAARSAGVRDWGGVPPLPSTGSRTLLHPPDQGGDGRPRRPSALSAPRVQHLQLRPLPRPGRRAGALRRNHRLPAPRLRPCARQPPRGAACDGCLPAPARKLDSRATALFRATNREDRAEHRRFAIRPHERRGAEAPAARARPCPSERLLRHPQCR